MCKSCLRTPTVGKYTSVMSIFFGNSHSYPCLFNHFFVVGVPVFFLYHINSPIVDILIHPYTLVLSRG